MMKRTSLIFALLLAMLMVMLPLQAFAAQGEGVTPEDGDISITIPSTPNTPAVYTVVFKDADGTVLSMQNYNYGDAVVAPEAPAKAADETYTYEFAGWNKEVTNCVGNAVYTATYNATYIEYTVKFVNEDGSEISSATYHYGDTVVVPADPTKEADAEYTYEFAGWTPEVAATVAGNAEYTAKFTATKIEAPVVNAIVKQPEAVTTDSGNSVQFSVEATGDVVSYKWEYRKVYKWFSTSMTGYNTDTLTVPATGQRNGYDYRCTVTFADGTVIVSEPAELTVKTYMDITYHPNDQTVVLGYKGQFTAAAEGEGLKYQWQYKRPGSELWIDTAMEGCTKLTVMIETTTARDGYQYRCEITDVTGNVRYTEAATMRVLSFTAHPQEAFASVGANATFTVQTSVPEGFTYQWQYRKPGGNWSNTTMTGYNTNTLTVAATLARNGYEYQCVLTGSKNSQIASKAAVLHVGNPVVFTAQPADVNVAAAGEIATFTVVAENAYAYQWQFYNPINAVWKNTSADGNTTDTLNVTVKANNNNYQYRCIVYGLDGIDYISDAATLTIG